jgi:hypothetical protein
MLLDVIHHPVFIKKHRSVYFSKHSISETGFCLRLQMGHTQLGPLHRVSPYLSILAQLSRFYLKMETLQYPKCCVLKNE